MRMKMKYSYNKRCYLSLAKFFVALNILLSLTIFFAFLILYYLIILIKRSNKWNNLMRSYIVFLPIITVIFTRHTGDLVCFGNHGLALVWVQPDRIKFFNVLDLYINIININYWSIFTSNILNISKNYVFFSIIYIT